ncbi:MAG: hypothetical protein IJJ44_12990 [Solobacterium sp.]|nr:hypothetical protein [Solobacterium sp.]
MKSIYDKIRENLLPDGTLPEDFSLQDNDLPFGFADGAVDGMALYHGFRSEADSEALLNVIDAACEGEFKNAQEMLEEAFQAPFARVLSAADEIQNYAAEKTEDTRKRALYSFASTLITQSEKIECVKFGLLLLEVLNFQVENTRNDVRMLSAAEELTLFALYVMQGWENANEEYFRTAKKTRGWGRIHSVRYLRAENEEIRSWLLTEGYKNAILNAYTVWECTQKLDLPELLRGSLTDAEYNGLSEILQELLVQGGPMPGMDEISGAEDLLLQYIKTAGTRKVTETVLETLIAIQDHTFTSDYIHQKDILVGCERILNSEQAEELVKDLVREHRGYALASYLNMDIGEQILEDMKTDFADHWEDIDYVWEDREIMEQVTELYRQEIDLTEIATGPEEQSRFTFDSHLLYYITRRLHRYPGMGEDLILASLKSYDIRNRITALDVIDAWKLRGYAHSQEIEDALSELAYTEPEEGIRERLTKKESMMN